MSSLPTLIVEQARGTDLVSPKSQTSSPVIPFPDYVDLLSSPHIEPDVLSNRFGVGHTVPSEFIKEAVIKLADNGRKKRCREEVRHEQASVLHISEEISSMPYYPLQPLSLWHPTKGNGRYQSGYVKLPPGSYNKWITGKGVEKNGEEMGADILRAAISRVDPIWLVSNLTSAAFMSTVGIQMMGEGDGSGAAVPQLDSIRLASDLTAAAARRA